MGHVQQSRAFLVAPPRRDSLRLSESAEELLPPPRSNTHEALSFGAERQSIEL